MAKYSKQELQAIITFYIGVTSPLWIGALIGGFDGMLVGGCIGFLIKVIAQQLRRRYKEGMIWGVLPTGTNGMDLIVHTSRKIHHPTLRNVFYNPAFLFFNNMKIAMCYAQTSHELAKAGQTLYWIFVDHKFVKKFDKLEQEFIIQHEVGHMNDVVYNGMANDRTFSVLQAELNPAEAAADLYAAKVVGRDVAISTLRKMKLFVKKGAIHELDLRIAALEKAEI